MLFLLSPAKSLDYESALPAGVARKATEPVFQDQAAELIGVLKPLTPKKIAGLMDLSDKLADLNAARYAAWSLKPTATNSRPAVLAFNGDVYDGLQAQELSAADLAWAQEHVVILSGLYGALRPMDKLQPYRLEMSTRLPNSRGPDLYAFWGDEVANHLNGRLSGRASLSSGEPVVVNLASQEYFKVVDRQALKARVVECVFEDWKDGRYKIISFLAKRARGLMARHAIAQRARKVEDLQSFALDGYAFDAGASAPDRLVFRRRKG